MPDLQLSVVIISYNMEREIPRTIKSLSPEIQRGIHKDDYEIIVVDNGSKQPLKTPDWGANLRIEHMQNPSHSPVAAINRGLGLANGKIVGVMIDGARMASPGLLAGVLAASRVHPRPVIGSLSFHLGHEIQNRSILKGYNQQVEDKLLADAHWEEDAYRLFDISVFAGSSNNGWFMPIAESNAIFLPKPLWEEQGGVDERFVTIGGGLVNLDIYERSCGLPDSQLIILLGEGTFHQFHGGVASNVKDKDSQWNEFHDEYVRIRGRAFARPTQTPLYVGHVHPKTLPFMEESIKKARRQETDGNFILKLAKRLGMA